jgi:hypothetical protein
LNKLILTLTEENYDWSFDFNTKKDFISVGLELGYDFKSSKTTREVTDFIFDRVKTILTSDECSFKEFITISDQVSFEFYCNNKHKNLFTFLDKLRSCINHLDSYSIDKNNWIKAHKLLQFYISISNHITEEVQLYSENRIIGKAVRRLRKKGIKVDVIEGNINISESQFNNIIQGMEYRSKKLGIELYGSILAQIESKYHFRHDRYYLRKAVTIDDNDPQIPLGYLYNLSIRHMQKTELKTILKNKLLKEIFELAEDIMTVYKLQILNCYEGMLSGSYDILAFIRKNLLHDQLFSIPQYCNKNVRKIIHGLFNKSKNSELPVDLSIYLDIFDITNKISNKKTYFILVDDIYYNLCGKYTKEQLTTAIEDFCLNKESLNRGYIDPFEVKNINYYSKPFIKDGVSIKYLNSYFHSTGFISVLFSQLQKKSKEINITGNKFAKLFGDISERFVGNLLIEKNITFVAGAKYKVKGNILKNIKSDAKEGECDFIIETNDKIIFIEQKSKTLTSDARKGDVVSGLLDISQSLLNATEQIGRHEFILRKQGFIEFENSPRLELKGRQIEKVSLTLFDFYSLADVDSVRSLLTTLVNSTVSYSENDPVILKKIKEINKTLSKIQNQYNSQEFRDEYIKDNNFLITLNNRFFSSNQLITMLELCEGNEQFINIMDKTRSIANSSQDWFLIFNQFAVDLYKKSN